MDFNNEFFDFVEKFEENNLLGDNNRLAYESAKWAVRWFAEQLCAYSAGAAVLAEEDIHEILMSVTDERDEQ